MRKGILFLVFVLLLVTPVSAEIAFGPGAEGVLYSGDGVAELQALFGSALAMVISFTTWHSVGWAILHGLLGWVYVIYYVIRY